MHESHKCIFIYYLPWLRLWHWLQVIHSLSNELSKIILATTADDDRALDVDGHALIVRRLLGDVIVPLAMVPVGWLVNSGKVGRIGVMTELRVAIVHIMAVAVHHWGVSYMGRTLCLIMCSQSFYHIYFY